MDLTNAPKLKNAVLSGTKDASDPAFDRYRLDNAVLEIDKTVIILPDGNPFKDVKEGQYFYAPILWAYTQEPQITGGTDATHFSPNATCTRGQVVTFLYRAVTGNGQ